MSEALSRYDDDAGTTADYIVVELAKHILGDNWLDECVTKANAGGIERVLLDEHVGVWWGSRRMTMDATPDARVAPLWARRCGLQARDF